MKRLLEEIRHNPPLQLLVFVPVVFVAQRLKPEAHTLLFVLSVLAVVPLAALLSHATESVTAKTGDAIGGLLNATLGNLAELVIAVAALRAGAAAVFLWVFLTTFPVALQFMFMTDVARATRVSNLIAIVMLFLAGYAFGRVAAYHPWLTGLAMVVLGAVLVAMTIALGG